MRKQREQGEDPNFSKGNQAIAELLLQGRSSQERKILQVVACCRWFDLAIIRHLLNSDGLGLQNVNDDAESYFEWLKGSDFVEFTKRHYRLDDVARDVFRQSYFQDDQTQFRKTNSLIADYFKGQADEVVDPQSLLPDSYEDEDWRGLMAEFLYYSLLGKKREGLQQYIEQVFAAVYLRELDIFMVPFAFISAEMSEENQNLLPKATGEFFNDSGIALGLGLFFLDKIPGSYKLEFEGDANFPEKAIEKRLKKIEDSLQALLGHVDSLPDGFGKSIGLMYKSLRCTRSRERTSLLLQVKTQMEQLLTYCRPKLVHNLLSNLGKLLISAERYQDSLDCYEKAFELAQGNAVNFLDQGIALGNLERYQEALESFQTAIDLDPKSVGAWVNHGAALFHLARYQEALESFQTAIDLDPKDVNAWAKRGDALRSLKRYEEALTALNRAIEIDPENAGALNSQALTLSFLKDFKNALLAIDKVINLKLEEVVFRANRGIILARAERYTESLTECEKAIQQDSKHESGYYAKACYFALQNEIEQAVDHLQKAIDIAPRHSRREAKHNPDFDSIRTHERFRALVYLES